MSKPKFVLFILASCILLQILKANKQDTEKVEKVLKKTKVDKKVKEVFMAWETITDLDTFGDLKKKCYEKCNELSIKKG